VASPGDEPIGPHQQAAAVGHLADLDPFAIDIVEVLAQADARGPDRHAELGRDRRGGLTQMSAKGHKQTRHLLGRARQGAPPKHSVRKSMNALILGMR
jgi:hypothetical protein